MEKAIKCPYCGGEMLVANVTEKIVCEYCDEVFSLAQKMKANRVQREMKSIKNLLCPKRRYKRLQKKCLNFILTPLMKRD